MHRLSRRLALVLYSQWQSWKKYLGINLAIAA